VKPFSQVVLCIITFFIQLWNILYSSSTKLYHIYLLLQFLLTILSFILKLVRILFHPSYQNDSLSIIFAVSKLYPFFKHPCTIFQTYLLPFQPQYHSISVSRPTMPLQHIQLDYFPIIYAAWSVTTLLSESSLPLLHI